MNKKIMVVDDDPDILVSVREVFEKEGCEVIEANGGKECLSLLSNGDKPDVILLDIMMPDINGWDVFTKIKGKAGCKGIPVVFLTCKSDKYSKGFGKFSADDYITKPFNIKDLKEKILDILKE